MTPEPITGAVASAPSTHVTVIVDDSDDDAAPRAPMRRLARYRAGTFTCDDMDLDRITERRRWLSGDGLAVFTRAMLAQLDVTAVVGLAHSRLLHDVECYERALEDGLSSEAHIAAYKTPITEALSDVGGVPDSYDMLTRCI